MPFIKKTLEKIIGEERFDRLKDKTIYKFCVEGFAMNTFFYPVAAMFELGFAGMDFSEHVYTRIVNTAANTLLARPYGWARDKFLKKIGVNGKSSKLKKYLGDTAAFFLLQLPLYWGSLAVCGAELDEIVRAAIPATLLSGTFGRPYGIYLDWIRKESGLKPEYLIEKQK